jgi:tRNA (guanosine-2'-O-)-methyltransferase
MTFSTDFLTEKEKEKMLEVMTIERFSKMIRNINLRSDYITVIAENFYNPGNVSALIRTIDALGFKDIHVLQYENKFEVNRKIAKGAEKWVVINKHSNLEKCFANLKEKGYKIYYADPSPDNPSIFDLPLDNKTAILFGQEKPGVTEEAKKISDGGFRIPLYGFVESFNVSVSVAITLSTLRKKLEEQKIDFLLSKEEKRKLLDRWIKKHTKKDISILS